MSEKNTDLTQQDKPVLIRVAQVMAITGVSRASIYKAMKRGVFPKPIKTNMGATAWVESEIYGYVQNQISTFRGEDSEHSNATA